MTEPLKILRKEYLSQLENDPMKWDKFYERGNFSEHPNHENGILHFPREIDITNLTKLKPVIENGTVDANETDKKNCKIIYETLSKPENGKGLTPREAIESGIWTRLCHYECLGYLKLRWKYNPKFSKKNYYIDHFLAKNPNSIRYENGIGQLWWTGNRLDHPEVKKDFNFDEAIEIFFKSTDMINRVMGSTTIMSYPKLIAAVIRLMGRKKNFTSDKSPLKDADGVNLFKYRRFFINLGSRMTSNNVHRFNRGELDDYFEEIWTSS